MLLLLVGGRLLIIIVVLLLLLVLFLDLLLLDSVSDFLLVHFPLNPQARLLAGQRLSGEVAMLESLSGSDSVLGIQDEHLRYEVEGMVVSAII
jgi:hypothetical protein